MICQKCNNVGTIERDGRLYECVCSFLKRVSQSMPMFIRTAEINEQHLRLPIIARFNRSLYVTSPWSDMKAIIKVLFLKYPSKFIKITSDAEIRDVYVGSKSKAAKSSDFDGEIFNNLQDLVDPPDLLILKLNEIYNKNKAAPGAVEESLIYRANRDKTTWLYSDVDRPFSTSSFAYSESLAELIDDGFERVNIDRIINKKSSFTTTTSSDVIEFDKKQEIKPEEKKKSKVVQPSDDVDDDVMSKYGQGLGSQKRKSFRG